MQSHKERQPGGWLEAGRPSNNMITNNISQTVGVKRSNLDALLRLSRLNQLRCVSSRANKRTSISNNPLVSLYCLFTHSHSHNTRQTLPSGHVSPSETRRGGVGWGGGLEGGYSRTTPSRSLSKPCHKHNIELVANGVAFTCREPRSFAMKTSNKLPIVQKLHGRVEGGRAGKKGGK